MPLQARLEPVAVAGDVEDVHVVGEAVEQGTGQTFVTGEDLRPFREWKIGRHDQAGLLVAPAEEAEQMLGATAIQRDVTEFVDYDQVIAGDVLLQPQYLAFFPGFDVGVHQTRDREETDLVSASTTFAFDRPRRPSHPSRADAEGDGAEGATPASSRTRGREIKSTLETLPRIWRRNLFLQ